MLLNHIASSHNHYIIKWNNNEIILKNFSVFTHKSGKCLRHKNDQSFIFGGKKKEKQSKEYTARWDIVFSQTTLKN